MNTTDQAVSRLYIFLDKLKYQKIVNHSVNCSEIGVAGSPFEDFWPAGQKYLRLMMRRFLSAPASGDANFFVEEELDDQLPVFYSTAVLSKVFKYLRMWEFTEHLYDTLDDYYLARIVEALFGEIEEKIGSISNLKLSDSESQIIKFVSQAISMFYGFVYTIGRDTLAIRRSQELVLPRSVKPSTVAELPEKEDSALALALQRGSSLEIYQALFDLVVASVDQHHLHAVKHRIKHTLTRSNPMRIRVFTRFFLNMLIPRSEPSYMRVRTVCLDALRESDVHLICSTHKELDVISSADFLTPTEKDRLYACILVDELGT